MSRKRLTGSLSGLFAELRLSRPCRLTSRGLSRTGCHAGRRLHTADAALSRLARLITGLPSLVLGLIAGSFDCVTSLEGGCVCGETSGLSVLAGLGGLQLLSCALGIGRLSLSEPLGLGLLDSSLGTEITALALGSALSGGRALLSESSNLLALARLVQVVPSASGSGRTENTCYGCFLLTGESLALLG